VVKLVEHSPPKLLVLSVDECMQTNGSRTTLHWPAAITTFTAKAATWSTAQASGEWRPENNHDTPKRVRNIRLFSFYRCGTSNRETEVLLWKAEITRRNTGIGTFRKVTLYFLSLQLDYSKFMDWIDVMGVTWNTRPFRFVNVGNPLCLHFHCMWSPLKPFNY